MESNRDLARNEEIVVELSIDKMLGVVSFIEPGKDGSELSEEQIKRAIAHKGIVYGIEKDTLEEIVIKRKYNYKYIIAKGKRPEVGQDGYIDYKFDRANINKVTPTLKEDGTVDYKDLGIIHNTRQDDILAVKVLPQVGEDGFNVLGEVLSGRVGKDVRIPVGKNTRVLPDKLTLVAAIDGQIEYGLESISISPTFFVDHDVDSSIGNIDFIGNVTVNGIVQSGYRIKAKGNVEVRGYVEAAHIEAGGNIILHYGIQGGDKGVLHAGGNVIAKFIQNSNVYAGEDIITEAILHSEVSADGEILVQKGKGTLVGGSTIAGRKIVANTIGSNMSTVTHIQIGTSKEVLNEYKNQMIRFRELREEIDKVDKSINFLESKAKEGTLPQDRLELLDKLIKTKQFLVTEMQRVKITCTEKEEIISCSDTGMIQIKDKVYQGVRVIIGNATKYIAKEQGNCLIRKVGGEISIL